MSGDILNFVSIGWYIFGAGCGVFGGAIMFKDVEYSKLAALPLILGGFIMLVTQVLS